MKRRIIILLMALVAMASCSKDAVTSSTSGPVKVTFKARHIESKAAFGTQVDNSYPTLWTDSDEDLFVSLNGADAVDAIVIPDAGKKTAQITAEVVDDKSGDYYYTALSPASAASKENIPIYENKWYFWIPQQQTPSAGSPDESAMIIMGESEHSSIFSTEVVMDFHHLTAYGCLNFTNLSLESGDAVSMVVVKSANAFAGGWTYDISSRAIAADATIKQVMITTSATSNIWFSCAPCAVGGTKMTFELFTQKGYCIKKEVTMPSSCEFKSGHVANLTVDMDGLKPVDSEKFEIVTKLSDLSSGDKVLLVYRNNSVVAGAISSEILKSVSCTFEDTDKTKITKAPSDAQVFTVTGSADTWQFTNTSGSYLSSSTAKKMAWSSEAQNWTLSISTDCTATMSTKVGTLKYNTDSPRFTTYSSSSSGDMLKLIQLFHNCSGVDPTPEPEPEPGPNPGPGPSPGGAVKGWFELPAQQDDDHNGIDDNNSDYYYSWTMRADASTIRNFSCCYSKSKIHPVWMAAPMHSCYRGSSGRNDAYKADPNISCTQAGKWDGYTRGHMLGSNDRTISKSTNQQVFYYSNIGAQLSDGFNTGGGAWNNLEDFVDGQWCADTLYQVVGCIFESFTDKYGSTVSPKTASGSQIPTAYYKVLLRTKAGSSGKRVDQCTASELKCVAFILSHKSNKSHKPESRDMYSVEDVEKLTGLTFFVNVPNAPKSTYTASDWGL